jgi:hypothetical protein
VVRWGNGWRTTSNSKDMEVSWNPWILLHGHKQIMWRASSWSSTIYLTLMFLNCLYLSISLSF